MKAQHKVLATRILWGGSFAILLFIFIIGNRSFMETRKNTEAIKNNTQVTQALVKELQKAVKDIQTDSHNDHDLQIKYVQCIVNLFGSKPGVIITQADFDKCLAGTRIDPASTSQPVPNSAPNTNTPKNSINKNTTTQNSAQQDSSQNQNDPKGPVAQLRTTFDLIISKAKGLFQ